MRERTEAAATTSTAGPDAPGSADHQGPAAPRRAATGVAATATTTGGGMTPFQTEARKLVYDCDRCARYHTARRTFFDAWHRWMMVGVLVSGSAAVASLNATFGSGKALTTVLMLVPVIVGAINVVWGIAQRARDHEVLARRFYDLAKRINVMEADAGAVEGWRASILDIYSDEPALYHALNAECHNAVAQAIGADASQMQRVLWWQHKLRHWLRFSTKDFPKNADIAA